MVGQKLLVCVCVAATTGACAAGAGKGKDHHRKHHESEAVEGRSSSEAGEDEGGPSEASADRRNRWGVKTTLVPGADPHQGRPVPLPVLLALSAVQGVTENDPRYQDARIPPFQIAAGLKEGDIVTVSGWLHLVAAPADGDYHLQLTASRESGEDCLIVEIPDPSPSVTKSAEMRPLFERARRFVLTDMLNGVEPEKRGTLVEPARYVTVTGQLFFDDAHVGEPPRGKLKQLSATLWEVHPVTAIGFATPP